MSIPADIFSILPGVNFFPTLFDFLFSHVLTKTSYSLVLPHQYGVMACREAWGKHKKAKMPHICTLVNLLNSLKKPIADKTSLHSFILSECSSSQLSTLEQITQDITSIFSENINIIDIQNKDINILYGVEKQRLLFLKDITEKWTNHCYEKGFLPSQYHAMTLLKKPSHHYIFVGSTFYDPALIHMVKLLLDEGKATVILPGYSSFKAKKTSHILNPYSSMSHFLTFIKKDVKILHKSSKRWDVLCSLFDVDTKNSLKNWRCIESNVIEKAMKGISYISTSDQISSCKIVAETIQFLLNCREKSDISVVSPDISLLCATAKELEGRAIFPKVSSSIMLQKLGDSPWGILLKKSIIAYESMRIDHIMDMLWSPLFSIHQDHLSSMEAFLGKKISLTLQWQHIAWKLPQHKSFAKCVSQHLNSLAQNMPIEHNFHQKWTTHTTIIKNMMTKLSLITSHKQEEERHDWEDHMMEKVFAIGQISDEKYKEFLPSLLNKISLSSQKTPSKNVSSGSSNIFLKTLMEQRLQPSNIIFLLGMDENYLQKELSLRSFLTDNIRSTLGMQQARKILDLKANDWLQAMMTPRVYLVSSLKKDGKSVEENHFIRRLKIFLRVRNQEHLLNNRNFFSHLGIEKEKSQHLHQPLEKKQESYDKPASSSKYLLNASTHPFSLPKKRWFIPVSKIGNLWQNPYVFYASCYLGLQPLRALSCNISESDIRMQEGIFIHRVLEKYVQQFPLPKTYQHAQERFYDAYKECLSNDSLEGMYAMFLQKRIEKIAQWLVSTNVFHNIIDVQVERTLSANISLSNILLKGRVDLILYKEKGISLWDYKTGSRVKPASKSHQIKFLVFLYEKIDKKKISKTGIIYLPRGRTLGIVDTCPYESIDQQLEDKLKEHLDGKPFIWDKKHAMHNDKGPGSYQHLARFLSSRR